MDENDRRDVARVRERLLAWYDENARDLPWRRTKDPYAIWVSEIMLQQTRVETVLPYYARFLERFPSVLALAAAPESDVLAMWSGLGYYRRARLLHRGARHVAELHGGLVPADVESIRAIPGVGAYTTGAIGSQAFDLEAPLVDGNVARVAARLCAIEEDVKKGKGLGRAWRIAEALVRGPRPGALNNALMELGAVVCVPREPRCLLCPLRDDCAARREGRERSLPVITEKAVRPRVREIAAVLHLEGAAGTGARSVLLARCAADGLFAGMWEPPRVTTTDVHAARASLASMLGVDVVLSSEETRHVEHVLTHRVLDVAVHEGTVGEVPRSAERSPERARYDAWELVSLERLKERGISTFARKLLGAPRG
jgi:A/G-specific adenine glycosylase